MDAERAHWTRATLGHKSHQRAAIVSAALGLLARHGVSGLTMAAIAAEAEISRQTLYRYFPDVDAVLTGLARSLGDADADFAAEVHQLPDPPAQLERVLDTVVDAAGHSPLAVAAVEGAMPPTARRLLYEHEQRAVALVADILQRGRERGDFGDGVEPELDAPLLIGLARGAHPGLLHRVRVLVDRITGPEEPE